MKIFITTILIFFLGMRLSMASEPYELAVDYEEKIIAYTDREVYISGENLLFSVSLTCNQDDQLVHSKYAYLVIRDKENRHVADLRLKLVDNRFSGRIYLPDTLKTDYYQILAFTHFMRNSGEDSFFKKDLIIANRFDQKLETLKFSAVQSLPSQDLSEKSIVFLNEKEFIHTRDKVKLDISLPSYIKENASLSVIVRERQRWKNGPGKEDEEHNIKDGFRRNQEISDDLDFYYPEYKGIFLSGRVLDMASKPLANQRVMVFTADTAANMKYDITDEKGRFSILLTEYYCGKFIVLKMEKAEKALILIDNKYGLTNSYEPPDEVLSSDVKTYIEEAQSIVKIAKAFPVALSEVQASKSNSINIPLVYLKPDAVVDPSEYQLLEDFKEVSREILPGVQIRERNGIFTSSIYCEQTRLFFSYPPAIFLNGIMIDEVSQILDFGTEEILKVEYILRERFVGDMSMKGILSVFTKAGAAPDFEFLTPNKEELILPNYPSMIRFKGVYYDNIESLKNPKPDLRQTLYWDSGLELAPGENKSIDFYCSDLDGDYEVIINGVSKSGQSFTVGSSFKVVTTR